jgi:DNA polymerase I-like protein with 3'-5' exonuclease and polymerase domains
MKRALVIFDRDLQEEGLQPGLDYEFVANVHDEWQIETKPDVAEEVAEIGKQSIVKAGEFYEFRCPLAADAKIGTTWADTH